MWKSLVARSLDRLNVALVGWRLRQDPAFGAAGAGAGHARHVSPLGEPRMTGVRGGVEIWRGGGGDWIATRVPGAEEGRAVVFLHGWLASGLQLRYYRWLAAPLAEDAELWFPRLPAHGERTPEGAVSGSRCLGPDVERTASCVRQAVAETRWLSEWLRRRGRTVSLWGISLGGWVAALAATRPVCDRLVLWEPVVDPLETASWSPLGRLLGGDADALTGDPALAEALADMVPLRHRLALPGGRVLVIGGTHDNVVRHDSLARAARHWGARFESLEHGHISLLLSRRALRLTLAELRHARQA